MMMAMELRWIERAEKKKEKIPRKYSSRHLAVELRATVGSGDALCRGHRRDGRACLDGHLGASQARPLRGFTIAARLEAEPTWVKPGIA